MPVLLLAGAIAGLFHYVPNTHVRWRHAFIGGAFVGLGLPSPKALLAWYVKEGADALHRLWRLATVPIFLIWIYLGWVIVLLGPSWRPMRRR